ncbi:hypothetical protein IT575_07740 [bacterium]|nr:hypothetical protein [bacterium]
MLEFDPYDTPPLAFRLGLGAFCVLLCSLMLASLLPRGQGLYGVVVIGGLLLCGMFIATSNTGVKVASATVAYMAMLGLMLLFTPA